MRTLSTDFEQFFLEVNAFRFEALAIGPVHRELVLRYQRR